MVPGISYSVRFSSLSRKLTIRIDSKGQIIVIAPTGLPKYRIASFVESARDWIEKHRNLREDKPVLLSATSVYYFGKQYEVKVSRNFDGTVKVGKEIVIVSPLQSSDVAKATVTLLSSWLKSRAIEYITQRVYALSVQMGRTFAGLAFKQQKTRWGSCSSQKNLNFNWKLIHAPKEVIDYVIIHELAHTKYMNHGKGFWDFVAEFDPDHTHHKRWLQRFGSTED